MADVSKLIYLIDKWDVCAAEGNAGGLQAAIAHAKMIYWERYGKDLMRVTHYIVVDGSDLQAVGVEVYFSREEYDRKCDTSSASDAESTV